MSHTCDWLSCWLYESYLLSCWLYESYLLSCWLWIKLNKTSGSNNFCSFIVFLAVHTKKTIFVLFLLCSHLLMWVRNLYLSSLHSRPARTALARTIMVTTMATRVQNNEMYFFFPFTSRMLARTVFNRTDNSMVFYLCAYNLIAIQIMKETDL